MNRNRPVVVGIIFDDDALITGRYTIQVRHNELRLVEERICLFAPVGSAFDLCKSAEQAPAIAGEHPLGLIHPLFPGTGFLGFGVLRFDK